MNCIKPNCNKQVASKRAGLCSTHYDQDIFRVKYPFYRTWQSMKSRCYNPNDGNYYLYGARGIAVCDRWLSSYNDFVLDITTLGVKPTPAHTLDRIDNDKGYELENMRWATKKEQIANRRPEEKPRVTNRARAIGIRYHQKRWQARGRHGVHIGVFDTKEEAIKAREEYIKQQKTIDII